jgi:hypothetical protein
VSKLRLVPIDLDDANAFVRLYHRHHEPVAGHKFSLGCAIGETIIGIVIVGRPTSRMRQDGNTLEVTRLCTDGVKRPTGRLNRSGEPCFHNPCSFLYAAAARAAHALGYGRIGTYTLKTESGASLVAAGWRVISETTGGSWNRKGRPRVDKHPTAPKLLWEPA